MDDEEGVGLVASSLYERLGEGGAVSAVVEDFVARCAADDRINGKFAARISLV